MKKVYKYYIEDTNFGSGLAYVEFDVESGEPLRQVNDYVNILLYCYWDADNGKEVGTCYLSEQNINSGFNHEEDKVLEEIFRRKWERAIAIQDDRLDIQNKHELSLEEAQSIIIRINR
ncbi:hypothetical protein E5K00_03325 [Hymenobacter aquaticus]|uniref:Uncharacterized protein n=1 Tax=Hymenobacter aquaticus TaxID=1867101 RepID=A0A4Z0Q2E5_9BACT|nr:hypothetical protein [Hymenobacter aquaticus]TGE24258.1 hypothetical protein E5K00_03325 [Hymenobacter aquaticus]